MSFTKDLVLKRDIDCYTQLDPNGDAYRQEVVRVIIGVCLKHEVNPRVPLDVFRINGFIWHELKEQKLLKPGMDRIKFARELTNRVWDAHINAFQIAQREKGPLVISQDQYEINFKARLEAIALIEDKGENRNGRRRRKGRVRTS